MSPIIDFENAVQDYASRFKNLPKFNNIYDFYETIVSTIKPNFDQGPYIAGSFAMRLYCREQLNHHDIDVFTRTIDQFSSLCELMSNKFPHISRFVSDNATTFRYDADNGECYMMQIIQPNRGNNLNQILGSFDIRACRFATDGKTFKFDQDALNDAKNKIAKFVTHNDKTLKRVVKYTAYGFKVDDATLQYVMENIDTFDVSNSDGY